MSDEFFEAIETIIAETIKRDLLTKGFFLATPIGFFYFLNEMRRLYELNREKIDYVALIGDWYSLNPQEPEFAYVLHVLQIESYARRIIIRSRHTDGLITQWIKIVV